MMNEKSLSRTRDKKEENPSSQNGIYIHLKVNSKANASPNGLHRFSHFPLEKNVSKTVSTLHYLLNNGLKFLQLETMVFHPCCRNNQDDKNAIGIEKKNAAMY